MQPTGAPQRGAHSRLGTRTFRFLWQALLVLVGALTLLLNHHAMRIETGGGFFTATGVSFMDGCGGCDSSGLGCAGSLGCWRCQCRWMAYTVEGEALMRERCGVFAWHEKTVCSATNVCATSAIGRHP
ncbi:hypothetical protein HaLaN_10963 [Haematococcus lacustris]|uniref:Uncharacterized protein n=1 Tax=Haematococcus lacustris TaxID=44745 RepID=A0A699YZ43_HAELA|nr:hypothetical protein HaLaN_10963 [Haematococcus lacustris]